MKKKPLITIAITCFNAEKTIERALLSAINQDWTNFEIIVVDDASTDSSKEILKKYESKYININVIYQFKNKGCAYSRNQLIANANGDFIAFFDDDDFSSSKRIRLQYEHLINYEKVQATKFVACFASGFRIYPNSYKKNILAVGAFGQPPIGFQMVNYLLFNERMKGIDYGAGVPTCSLLARTIVLKNAGGFDSKIRRQEDIDFAIRLAKNGCHFIGIKEQVIKQYVSFTNDKSALIEYKSSLLVIEKNKDYLVSKRLYNYMKLWVKIKFFHLSKNDFVAFFVLLAIFFSYPIRTVKHFSRSSFNRFLHEQFINSTPKRLMIKRNCVKFLNYLINIFNHE
ncbi:glycosyltransferase [Prochlorococcus marinus]|uniref:glycosyltransferase n=1 Tax=Prochlorococcus marinus TaxID=1219 RepID=UPI001ADC71BD|nr:glycosyltransferase [Prochlorococcus marinus]MBO8217668.1 glycosyltransferase [Prochlorococcus marinus XMU1405]MBW3040830.1 glycosyl transferase [Prochlorococcus marinus str. MU1405]MBW3048289.1 glycosyl transferase [Prochlorococcus marinus str. MU1406]